MSCVSKVVPPLDVTGSHKRVETAARSNFSQKFLLKFCRSVVQEHRCPSSTRLRRHAECDEFSRSACSLIPALIFGAAARLSSAILHSCSPVLECHFRAGQSTFQHKVRRVCSVYPDTSLHRCSDNIFLLPSVCDLKETSGQKPHCMSLFAALQHSLST